MASRTSARVSNRPKLSHPWPTPHLHTATPRTTPPPRPLFLIRPRHRRPKTKRTKTGTHSGILTNTWRALIDKARQDRLGLESTPTNNADNATTRHGNWGRLDDARNHSPRRRRRPHLRVCQQPLALAHESLILSRASHLTYPEVLRRRRSHRLEQISSCYRDHYWTLMEELIAQCRVYCNVRMEADGLERDALNSEGTKENVGNRVANRNSAKAERKRGENAFVRDP
ncbi:hypothetical protein NL676_034708 [Syzygium grande]|nr:hypothetical protein NL676_034708 [Syzygium grande]